MYAAADVLVVPSIRTRTFREPWGLVVNEAMNRRLAVIASDAVGAAAGGLVRDERNGLVVPAGDSEALARAIARLADDPALRARLGAAGASDVRAYTHEAWAAGFSEALASRRTLPRRVASFGSAPHTSGLSHANDPPVQAHARPAGHLVALASRGRPARRGRRRRRSSDAARTAESLSGLQPGGLPAGAERAERRNRRVFRTAPS